MERFKIRELINVPPENFLTDYPKFFQIEFDDGEILEVSRKRTYGSAIYWRVFREFPEVTITKGVHFDAILGRKKLAASSHMKLATNVNLCVVNHYTFITPEQRERIQHHLQEATNDLYVGLRQHSGRHLQTIHLIDCIKLMYHPEIWKATMECPESTRGVEEVYATIQRVIETDPAIQDNGLVKAVRSGAVKFNQVCQSIGVRGYPKEVNGRIFRHLARGNYLFGIINLYEFAADSRGSAEHLSATESPLQDSEYFSRRLQLQAMVLERIAYEDCGTTRTIPMTIRPAGVDPASGESRSSDLKFMAGKVYVDPKSGKWAVLKGDEKHLEGKTIQMRSVLTCQHKDPHAVCQVCFGTLANNHSRWANVGVVAATTVVSKISQKTLSTKHHISSGQGSGIVFNDQLRLYFRRGPKNTDYVLHKDVMGWKPKIVVDRDSSLGLVDIVSADSIEDVNPERITSFDKVRFLCVSPDGTHVPDTLMLSQGKRNASMSTRLLEYVRQHGFITDERNNFVIDLEYWDPEDVIFTLPDIQVSFSAHGNAIAELVESKFKNLAERSTEDAPLRVLGQLFDMVTSKLDVNIAPIECIIYGLMQAAPGNYSMGRLADKPVLGIGKQLIWQRSLGTAFAYQEWADLFLDPKTYDADRPRPSTIMDVALDPKGYLTHHSKTYVNRLR